MLSTLLLTEDPDELLADHAADLDEAWRVTAAGLDANTSQADTLTGPLVGDHDPIRAPSAPTERRSEELAFVGSPWPPRLDI